MIPVLAVDDPKAAYQELMDHFGFRPTGKDRLALGDQQIQITRTGETPADLIDFRLDHIAFGTDDADRARARFEARGARLSEVTPNGPEDIPEFWGTGIRFVVFDGPEGWPIEFCAEGGPRAQVHRTGHGHIAVRTKDLDRVEARLNTLGASFIAEHTREESGVTVFVRFLALKKTVFEVFTATEFPSARAGHGWIGLLRD